MVLICHILAPTLYGCCVQSLEVKLNLRESTFLDRNTNQFVFQISINSHLSSDPKHELFPLVEVIELQIHQS